MSKPPAQPASTELRADQVLLDEPIQRGAQSISEITLRKPLAGDLRGISLNDLLHMDVNALRKVLPRLTTPALTDVEVGNLDPADLLDLGSKVASFLLKKSVKAQLSLPA